ncbi:spermidine resistance protein [Coemansia sp. BCRC 34301]|nr:spermidine resistance protein [Coemansia sp. BCRC 34301]
MTCLSSSQKVGDAQYAVSVTDNNTQAETMQLCTPTCSTNGTHSDGYTGAFEGPEKLLEMWFAPTCSAAIYADPGAVLCDEDQDQWSELRNGLRLVPRAVWRDMLDLVHCQVLSTLCNEHLDSYLLRQVESSFFVYPHKLVLKTCGTTTLLYAIPRILEIAHRYLGATGVYQVFYSRKNFMFPDQQEELHRSWEKEVAYLDARFPEGSAYMIGKTNRDHWHVYLCGPYESPLPCALDDGVTANNSAEGSPLVLALSRTSSHSTVHSLIEAVGVGSPGAPRASSDTTVEILMTGLDPDRMRAMYLGGASLLEGSLGGKAVERATGIASIYPDSASDSYLFTPCGFSLNGLQGDGYYTIHVTPEPHCSYASFETTVSSDSAIDLNSSAGVKRLVEQVTTVFGPRSVTVTVFRARGDSTTIDVGPELAVAGDGSGKTSEMAKAPLLAAASADTLPPVFAPVAGYKSIDRVLYEFDHYWLRYAYYAKAD